MHIYSNEMEDLKSNLEECKRVMDIKTYKFELLLCFWAAVHLIKFEYAYIIAQEDPLIIKILDNVRKLGRTFLIERLSKRFYEKDRKKHGSFKKDSGLAKSVRKISIDALQQSMISKKSDSKITVEGLSFKGVNDQTIPDAFI